MAIEQDVGTTNRKSVAVINLVDEWPKMESVADINAGIELVFWKDDYGYYISINNSLTREEIMKVRVLVSDPAIRRIELTESVFEGIDSLVDNEEFINSIVDSIITRRYSEQKGE